MDENDNYKYELETLRWLIDLQVTDDPQVINNFKITVFMQSRFIKDVELLAITETKQVLVLLKLSYLGNKLFKDTIENKVRKLIPKYFKGYAYDITFNEERFKGALELVKKVMEA